MWEIYQKERLFALKENHLQEEDVISVAMYTALYGVDILILQLINETRETPVSAIHLLLRCSSKINQIKEDKLNTVLPITMMLAFDPDIRPSAGDISNYLLIDHQRCGDCATLPIVPSVDLNDDNSGSKDSIGSNDTSDDPNRAQPPPADLVLLEKYDTISPVPGSFIDSELRKRTLLWLLSFNHRLNLKNETIFYAIKLLDTLTFVKRLTEANITYYAIVCLRIAEEYKEMSYYDLHEYLHVGGTITRSLFNCIRNEIYQAIDYKLHFTTVYDYYEQFKKKLSVINAGSYDNILVLLFSAILLPRQELMLAGIGSHKELFVQVLSLAEKIRCSDDLHSLLNDFEMRVFGVAYQNKSIYKSFRLSSPLAEKS
jgi:hypothetical protein